MSKHYSPIDEMSINESPGYDPAAMFGGSATSAESGDPRVFEPESETKVEESASPESQSAAAPSTAAATSATGAGSYAGEAAYDSDCKSGGSAFSRFLSMLADSRTAMFAGLVLVCVGVYSFIVSLSYLNNIGNDQSALLAGDFDPASINNAGGPVGAWLAHTLIYNYLGLGAFILIYYVIVCGLSLLKVWRPDFWPTTMRCLLGSIALSVIAGLVTYEYASPIYWGGLHGFILNEKLVTFTGIWGALGVSVILAGMMVILYLTSLKRLFGAISRRYAAYAAKREERRIIREEQARRRQAEREAAVAAQEAARAAEEEVRAAREAEEAAREAQAAAAAPVAAVATAEAEVEEREPYTVPREHERYAPAPATAEDEDTSEEYDSAEPAEEETYDEQEYSDDGTDECEDEAADEPEPEPYVEESLFTTHINIPAEKTAPDISLQKEAPVESLFRTDIHGREIDSTGQPVYDPRADLSHYQFPSLDLLPEKDDNKVSVDRDEMESNMERIRKTLADYDIPIAHIEATVGPTVTLYEIIPAEGVRIAKIKRLEDDIALSLAAIGIRIIAPIPGKGTIGIEVPNKEPSIVSMRSILGSAKYLETKMDLPMAIGKTISDEVFIADLCKMPHLLVAGATGMGKSVGLNAIIASLLYKKHPSELKFVLVDPKMVEFSLYSTIEHHYLAKLPDEEDAIITDPNKVVTTLNSLCVEMDNRYALLKDASMRNIKEYNDRFCHHLLNPEKGHRYLPYIVVIVDEFADLIMTAGKEVETPIARIAQKARAVGIHMILATQRPSTNVITGVIKANFPGRIAFRVFQMVDSRTIIDRPGANQLIGKGDMLFSNNGKIDRVQCAFIDTPEVKAICDAISSQVGYRCAYELPEYVPEGGDAAGLASIGDRDTLFEECARFIITAEQASTSSLQRRFSIGYNRAGKIMDQLEAAGIVGPNQGAKGRAVLVDQTLLESLLENL